MDKIISENSLFNLCIREDAWNDVKLYKEDYKEIIKVRESERIPYSHKSPQENFIIDPVCRFWMAYREYIIKYLKRVCSNKQLTLCTLHLSVYLLDIFMDNHSIIPERLLLVANVCLKIAAKVEENFNNIPKFSELNVENKINYSLVDYKSLEILVLQFFHWYIMFPTTAHYTHYFLQSVIATDDLNISGKSARCLIIAMMYTIHEFLDKIIDDTHYMQNYKPSKLACAIIAIARKKLNLPSWTKELEQITNYLEEDFESTKIALLDPDSIQCHCRSKQQITKNI